MLKLTDLVYRYPNSTQNSLNAIRLEIQAKQCVGLLGANGAGKTTLLSILAGLLQRTSGSMQWSQPVTLGLVPQSLAFYAGLSVQENLSLFADIYQLSAQQRQQQMALAIDAAQLSTLLKKKAGQLSGGQQRRLNFAIGLLAPANLFLLDEVTVGVDSLNRQHLLQSIQALKQEGKSIVYTSHYLPEVEQLADQLIILKQGNVLLNQSMHQELAQHCLHAEWPDSVPSSIIQFCTQLGLSFQHSKQSLSISNLAEEHWPTLLSLINSTSNAPSTLDYSRPSLEQFYLKACEETT